MPWVPDGVFATQLWLLENGKNFESVLQLLQDLVPRLQAAGVPLERVLVGSYYVHAQLGAVQYKYEAPHHYTENSVDRRRFAQLLDASPADSPFNQLKSRDENHRVRVRATDCPRTIPDEVKPFFVQKGYTDMYCQPVFFKGIMTVGISYGTKELTGFSDDQVAFLDAILPALGSITQFLVNELTTGSLLRTYLGGDPGSRVHAGSVDRGDTVTVRSVIWFSDIRDFTSLSQELRRDQIVSLIDQVFEITEEVVKNNGGEILKFMGDGWLVVFKDATEKRRASKLIEDCSIMEGLEDEDDEETEALDDSSASSYWADPVDEDLVPSDSDFLDSSHVCQMARKAAHDYQERLKILREERSRQGLPGPHVGVGLHYGDCSYGNVGAPTRLDFTVIGPAVNLASRVEGLCKKLKVSVLATKEFTKRDAQTAWAPAGKHWVKGVKLPVAVYDLQTTRCTTPRSLPNKLL